MNDTRVLLNALLTNKDMCEKSMYCTTGFEGTVSWVIAHHRMYRITTSIRLPVSVEGDSHEILFDLSVDLELMTTSHYTDYFRDVTVDRGDGVRRIDNARVRLLSSAKKKITDDQLWVGFK